MNDTEILLHDMCGTRAKILAVALMAIAKKCDTPKEIQQWNDLATMAYGAHKAVEALVAEVKRLNEEAKP